MAIEHAHRLGENLTLADDETLDEASYPAIVEAILTDGRRVSRRVDTYRGKADNPLSWSEVSEKARALIEPAVGPRRADSIIETVARLDSQTSAEDVGASLAA